MFIAIRSVKWLVAAGLIVSGVVLAMTGLGLANAGLLGRSGASLMTGTAAYLLSHAQYPALAAYPVPAGVLLILCGLLLFAL